MIVRARTDEDLRACERLARVVYQRDAYPARPPHDLLRFIADSDALSAWVAESDGILVGHVALHTRSSHQVMALAAEVAQLAAENLAVVARLLVSPEARRQGVGRALLTAVTDDATSRRLRPVLDVATHYDGAIRLYESCGWTRMGEVTVRFGATDPLDEYVYLSPEPRCSGTGAVVA